VQVAIFVLVNSCKCRFVFPAGGGFDAEFITEKESQNKFNVESRVLY
jgi:hypothetical protein